MMHTQILVHRLEPRTKILALSHKRTRTEVYFCLLRRLVHVLHAGSKLLVQSKTSVGFERIK